MTITSVKQQLKQKDRYSVFVDGVYSFSLSEQSLLASGLHSSMELSASQLDEYKKMSADDKLYAQALRYVAGRMHTEYEVISYLRRKAAPGPMIDATVHKFRTIGLLDDHKYAELFIQDRQTLKPSSRRKLKQDLRKKGIAEYIVDEIMQEEAPDERLALESLITSKRRQTKYQDDAKLMQYLARQGFSYGDITTALQNSDL